MRLLLIIAAASVLSGCGANYVGHVSTGGAALAPPVVTPAGSTVVTGPSGLYASVTVSGSAANFLYWFTGAGIYGAMLLDDLNQPGPFFPRMKEDRSIAEVDCTKPIPPEVIGNIKCR